MSDKEWIQQNMSCNQEGKDKKDLVVVVIIIVLLLFICYLLSQCGGI